MTSADQILYDKLAAAMADYLPAADDLLTDVLILVMAGKDTYHRILFYCDADIRLLDFFAELAVEHKTATVLFTIPFKRKHLDDILQIINEVVPQTVTTLPPQEGTTA